MAERCKVCGCFPCLRTCENKTIGEDDRVFDGLVGYALPPSLREVRRSLKWQGFHISLVPETEYQETVKKLTNDLTRAASEVERLTSENAALRMDINAVEHKAHEKKEELQAKLDSLQAKHGQLLRDYTPGVIHQELTRLRERVERAVTWLVSAQTAQFRFQATDAVKCALEALRDR